MRLPTCSSQALVTAIALAFSTQADAAQTPQGAPGEPVNLYAPGAVVYAPGEGGEIRSWHVQGKIWLLTGQPGESNVIVQVGDEGVLVVDTGVEAMASRLLEGIREVARREGATHQAVRLVINTGSARDHIGGNAVIRSDGSRVVAGEEAALQNLFGTSGAAVWAHQKVLDRLVDETAQGGPDAPPEALWPSDVEDQEVYNLQFNRESVQLHHPRSSTTDGQLLVLFRESNVIVAGDVLNMTSYPTIDVARGGTIDGVLVALNKLMDMTVSEDQVEGGTLVIPGHGRITDLGDIARYTVMLTTIRNRIQYYRNQGRTLEQVLALDPTGEYDARWSAPSGPGSAREFISAVYNTLPRRGAVFFSMETNTLVPATGRATDKRQF